MSLTESVTLNVVNLHIHHFSCFSGSTLSFFPCAFDVVSSLVSDSFLHNIRICILWVVDIETVPSMLAVALSYFNNAKMAIKFSGTDLGSPEFPLHRETCWKHSVCPIGAVD